MALEYAFFDASLAQRFAQEAKQRGISCEIEDDAVAGMVACLDEDAPEAELDALDAFYERLQEEQAALAANQDGWVTKRLAGIQVTLANGSLHTVRLDADTGNRLLAAFSPEEAQQLVQAIVHSLENPVDGPLCRGLHHSFERISASRHGR